MILIMTLLIINYLTDIDRHIACWRTNESTILVHLLVKMRIKTYTSRTENLQTLLNSTINASRACHPF